MNCPICDGEGVLLGTLGRREHFRCRACGGDYSHVPPALKPNRWTEIAFNVAAGRWEVKLFVANPVPDGEGHYAAQLKDRGWALTRKDAENIGAAMLRGEV